MNSFVWYHGANGDALLQILAARALKPKNGEIFLSAAGFAGCFAMGADLKRKACFVIKVRCHVPPGVEIKDRNTNVPGTKVICTSKPVAVEVLELYVRPKTGPVVTVRDASAIAKYLKGP